MPMKITSLGIGDSFQQSLLPLAQDKKGLSLGMPGLQSPVLERAGDRRAGHLGTSYKDCNKC